MLLELATGSGTARFAFSIALVRLCDVGAVLHEVVLGALLEHGDPSSPVPTSWIT
jgi:hypothetical protein